MHGIRAKWKPARQAVYELVKGEPYPEDAWEKRFYDLGYCNCPCHNHAQQHESHHSWGECQCYHPDRLYHDNGVLTGSPVRSLPTDRYDDALKHDGGATAGVMAILQTSLKPPAPKEPWYLLIWEYLFGWIRWIH